MEGPAIPIVRSVMAGPRPVRTVEAIVPNAHGVIDALVATGRLRRHGDRLHVGRLAYDHLGIAASLPENVTVHIDDEVDSTNDRASALLDAVDTDRVLAVARRQTAGRGRHDRIWSSPRGGVWASVGDATPRPAATGWVEPLAMAAATVIAVRAIGADVRLKWPNDVVSGTGAKVAGVLAESTVIGDTRTRTVCGVGINANTPIDALPPTATAVVAMHTTVDRRALLAHVYATYERLRARPGATVAVWQRHAETIDRPVRIETADGIVEGTVTGMTATGGLRLVVDGTATEVAPTDCRRLRHVERR